MLQYSLSVPVFRPAEPTAQQPAAQIISRNCGGPPGAEYLEASKCEASSELELTPRAGCIFENGFLDRRDKQWSTNQPATKPAVRPSGLRNSPLRTARPCWSADTHSARPPLRARALTEPEIAALGKCSAKHKMKPQIIPTADNHVAIVTPLRRCRTTSTSPFHSQKAILQHLGCRMRN